MHNILFRTRVYLTAISLLLLSACTTPLEQVTEVVSDKQAFLMKNFTKSLIPAALIEKAPKKSISGTRPSIKISTDATIEKLNLTKEQFGFSTFYLDDGDGFFKEMSEYSNNGIPFNITYSLNYMGFLVYKKQMVHLRATTVSNPYLLQELSRVDPSPSAIGQSMTILYDKNGDGKVVCKATKTQPANLIHKNLSGLAIGLECENFWKNIITERSDRAMLVDYGFSITLGVNSAENKTTYTVSDVTIGN
jgi:hypothetical protein